ncbi:MAG TPA: branched-chain amino acid ABC transporter permease [Acidimicrobiales bacterium]|nr:branched-chain amino acid ABC transporter permease [Acidimicrobiales bacterium]
MGEVVVFGLIAGGIYGLFAVGTVLVYRGSRVLNFAHGEIGMMCLFLAWYLVTERGLPWIVGALAAVALAAATGWAFERVVVRRMTEAPRVAVSVATVGLALLILATEIRLNGDNPRSLAGPIGGRGFQIAGVFVSPTQVLALLVTIAVAVGFATLLRRTDFGLGVLAAAQDPNMARLVGVPLGRVSGFVWAAGAAVTALGALLIAPTVQAFAPGAFGRLFLFGLAAAIVGGLTSLQGAFVGGIVVGLVEAGAGRLFAETSFPGLETLTIFVLMLLSLLLRPEGLLARSGGRRPA